jgi:3-deoxy-D-manno-octulosonic-acid transferase
MVFYGSSMEDFLDARKLLEKERAGVEVKNPDAFVEKALFFLNHQDELKEGGRGAPGMRSYAVKGPLRGMPGSLPV